MSHTVVGGVALAVGFTLGAAVIGIITDRNTLHVATRK